MEAPKCQRCGKPHWSNQPCAGGGFMFAPRILKAKWGRKDETESAVEETLAAMVPEFMDEERQDLRAWGFTARKVFEDGRIERIDPEDMFASPEPEPPAEDPRKVARREYQRELMRKKREAARKGGK